MRLRIQKKFGLRACKETDLDADLVVPVPDSGVPAALVMLFNLVKNLNLVLFVIIMLEELLSNQRKIFEVLV